MAPELDIILSLDLRARIALELQCSELALLRECSREWRAVVEYASFQHAECSDVELLWGEPEEKKRLLSFGRVFGRGCRRLHMCTITSLNDLRYTLQFLQCTSCAVVEMNFDGLHRWSNRGLSNEGLLAICAYTPRLVKLRGLSHNGCITVRMEATGNAAGELWLEDALVDNVAYELSQLCPFLEDVELPEHPSDVVSQRDCHARREALAQNGTVLDSLISTCETWARHFPKLKAIRMGPGFSGYRIHLRTVLATLSACPKVEDLVIQGLSLPGDTLLQLTRPYAPQLRVLDLSEAEDVCGAVVLECVRRCQALEELGLEPTTNHDFDTPTCIGIAAAVPRLKRLSLYGDWVTDPVTTGMLGVFEGLEFLSICNVDHISAVTFDALINSRTSHTLTELKVAYIGTVTARTVLLTVQRCAALSKLTWEGLWDTSTWINGDARSCAAHMRDTTRLLESRGGCYELDAPPEWWEELDADEEDSGEDDQDSAGDVGDED